MQHSIQPCARGTEVQCTRWQRCMRQGEVGRESLCRTAEAWLAGKGHRPALTMLDNIDVFIRSVELGSFSAAGRSLRLSAAVVSHRIQVLERHLSCRLFNRTTRKVQLTEQGRIFYERSLDIREAVERAEASVSEVGAAPRGTLRVTAPLGLGRRVIAPLVPRYRFLRPEIDVRLRLSDYMLDLLVEAMDIAVRMAHLADSSLVARHIADVPRALPRRACLPCTARHAAQDLRPVSPRLPDASLSRLQPIPLDVDGRGSARGDRTVGSHGRGRR